MAPFNHIGSQFQWFVRHPNNPRSRSYLSPCPLISFIPHGIAAQMLLASPEGAFVCFDFLRFLACTRQMEAILAKIQTIEIQTPNLKSLLIH